MAELAAAQERANFPIIDAEAIHEDQDQLAPVAEVEAQQSRIARLGNFVTAQAAEFKSTLTELKEAIPTPIAPTKAKAVAVLATAAAVFGGGFAQAKNHPKPMKPAAIKQYTFRHAATYNDKNDQRPTKITLTGNTMNIKGKCSKDEYNPMLKNWMDTVDRTKVLACNGRKANHNHPSYPDNHDNDLQKVSDKVALTAGVTSDMRGEATKLVVTNAKAKLRFGLPKQDELQVGTPVRTITFLKHGKPRITK